MVRHWIFSLSSAILTVSMLETIWFSFLYQPLFNALIWIYTNIANQNMGWAVIWLTVFLRILLLPLSIISEYNNHRKEKAVEEAQRAVSAYKNDRIAQKDVIRKIMKKYKVSPWARVLSLGIQALVLVLLYQVFIGGITGEKMIKILYPSIDFPGRINNNFYGFDIGAPHDYIWAGLAALYLLVAIFIESRGKKGWEKSEMYYLVLFPIFMFLILWWLPMVKSLFILTTMLFSDAISLLRHFFFAKKKEDAHTVHH